MHKHLHIDLYHVIQVKKKTQHFTVRQKIKYFVISKIIGNWENLHSNCVLDILVNNQILHTTFVHINTCKSSLIIQHMITKKRNLKKENKKIKNTNIFFKRWGNKIKQILIGLLVN